MAESQVGQPVIALPPVTSHCRTFGDAFDDKRGQVLGGATIDHAEPQPPSINQLLERRPVRMRLSMFSSALFSVLPSADLNGTDDRCHVMNTATLAACATTDK